jgi:hypothetical protein
MKVKKIGAVLAGAALLGATLAGAVAAQDVPIFFTFIIFPPYFVIQLLSI